MASRWSSCRPSICLSPAPSNGAAGRPERRAASSPTGSIRRPTGHPPSRRSGTGAFGLWAGLADINFAQAASADAANITLKRLPNQQAFAAFGVDWQVPVGSATINGAPQTGAYITIDTSHDTYGPLDAGSDTKGGYPYSTVIHEVGHIVGLGHGGPYNFSVNTEQQQFGAYDTEQWSIMSYIDPNDRRHASTATSHLRAVDRLGHDDRFGRRVRQQPLSPQMLDILAAQRLYGASTNTHLQRQPDLRLQLDLHRRLSSADLRLQGINPPAIVTIWNHGTDNTLDLSGFSQNATVDLTPGYLLERRRPRQQHRHRLRHRGRAGGRRQRQRHDPSPPASPPPWRAATATTC